MLNRLAVCFALLITTPVYAEGFYLGGELGVAATDDIVDTDRVSPVAPCAACVPSEVSLSGVRLDAQETAWSLFAGWNVRDWLSLELAYADLGEPGDPLYLVPPLLYNFGVVPAIDPDAYFAENPPALGTAGVLAVDLGWAALGIEEVSVNAVFRHALAKDFSAWWSLGLSFVSFEADGYFETIEIISLQPSVFEVHQVPFATPDDETGYRWGFGAEYAINERFALELGYRRHELQVIETDALSLRFLVRL